MPNSEPTTYQEKLEHFAALLQQSRLDRYLREYPGSPCAERDCAVRIVPGKKYAKVDVGSSGVYMVDLDGNIFGIKAYGVIHRGHRYGNLDTVDQWNWGGYKAGRKQEVV